MSTPQLRPYQAEIIAEFERRVAAGQRRLIIVMPTGSGKTVVAAEIARKVAAEKQRALFLAHRREIISQTSQKLFDVELDHGIIQAGIPGPAGRTCSGRKHPDAALARHSRLPHHAAASASSYH